MGKMCSDSEVLLQPGHKWNNIVFYNHTGLKMYPHYMCDSIPCAAAVQSPSCSHRRLLPCHAVRLQAAPPCLQRPHQHQQLPVVPGREIRSRLTEPLGGRMAAGWERGVLPGSRA